MEGHQGNSIQEALMMNILITAIMISTLSADVDSTKVALPENTMKDHPTYLAEADVKKKKKKGKKISGKGKKKKKGFFSKVFGSK